MRDFQHAVDPEVLQRAVNLLRRTANTMTGIYRVKTPDGVTVHQLMALHYLIAEGPRTLGQLAQRLDVTAGTVSPMIKKLEQKGLVTRKDDDEDKRLLWIAATRSGERAVERNMEAILPLNQMFEGWSATDVERLSKLLERLLSHRAGIGSVDWRAEASKPGLGRSSATVPRATRARLHPRF